MTTADKIRELAASGKWASAIADELGISRQRVYQLARSHDISMPRSRAHYVPAGSAFGSPKPRLLTGGVEVKVNHSVAGAISELLVAADLMARGWAVFLPVLASKGHDVIACKGGKVITIEVRSAHRNASGQIKYQKKADCESGYYGLVVTGEPVTYEPELPE